MPVCYVVNAGEECKGKAHLFCYNREHDRNQRSQRSFIDFVACECVASFHFSFHLFLKTYHLTWLHHTILILFRFLCETYSFYILGASYFIFSPYFSSIDIYIYVILLLMYFWHTTIDGRFTHYRIISNFGTKTEHIYHKHEILHFFLSVATKKQFMYYFIGLIDKKIEIIFISGPRKSKIQCNEMIGQSDFNFGLMTL